MAELEFLNPEPEIKLTHYFEEPYKTVIAAGKGCYSSRTKGVDEITEKDYHIAESTYKGGHHTLFEHPEFIFRMDNISRRLSYELCNFPFYNTSQQSQRYVELKKIQAYVPPISGDNKGMFEKAVRNSWKAYNELTDILFDHFLEKEGKKFTENQLRKKSIEEARYVIPLAAHTGMTYKVNGITLHRLNKMRNLTDVPHEFSNIIDIMIEEVNKIDPLFFEEIEDPYKLEDTLEHESIKFRNYKPEDSFKDFDVLLDGRKAKLGDYTPNAERIVADAIRTTIGLPSDNSAPDGEILNLVMDPAKNPYFTGILEVMVNSPISRALHHPHYTFYEKLSHTADYQNIRHRRTPGARVLFSYTDTEKPDVISPKVFNELPEAKQIFDDCVNELWGVKNNIVDNGVGFEFAHYLYPNAKTVRLVESGSAMDYLHKFKLRLCNRAQAEIQSNSVEKVEQLVNVHPNLFRWIAPQCNLRKRAKLRPYCLEGDLICKEKPYTPPAMIDTAFTGMPEDM